MPGLFALLAVRVICGAVGHRHSLADHASGSANSPGGLCSPWSVRVGNSASFTQASLGSDSELSMGLSIWLRESSVAMAIFANDQWLSALPSGQPSSSHIL